MTVRNKRRCFFFFWACITNKMLFCFKIHSIISLLFLFSLFFFFYMTSMASKPITTEDEEGIFWILLWSYKRGHNTFTTLSQLTNNYLRLWIKRKEGGTQEMTQVHTYLGWVRWTSCMTLLFSSCYFFKIFLFYHFLFNTTFY